jgi:hypothetical protein
MFYKIRYLLPFLLLVQNVFGQTNTLYSDGGLFLIDSQAIVQVNGNFEISDGEQFANYGTLNIAGDILDNGSLSDLRGKIRLVGNSLQNLDCANFFDLDTIEFNNPSGFMLNEKMRINGEGRFVSGIVNYAAFSIFGIDVLFSADAIVSTSMPPNDTCHINGQVTKLGIGTFIFPVGDGVKYQKVRTDLTINDEGVHVTYMPTDAGSAPFTNAGSDTTLLVWYNPSEHWIIKNETNLTGTVTIYWDGYRDSVLGGITDQRVAHQDDDWLNEGTSGIGSFTTGSVTSNSISSWSPFALGTISTAVPLPLNLIRFDAQAYEGYNQLNWQTGVESDNEYFELERSNDAQQYKSIVRLNAKGNNNNEYSFQDHYQWSGDVFYRLKMIQKNGSKRYSKVIRMVAKNKTLATSFIYPNPSKTSIIVSLKAASLIGSKARLIDPKGLVLQEIEIKTVLQTIDIAPYPNGNYLLSLDNGETFHFTKTE